VRRCGETVGTPPWPRVASGRRAVPEGRSPTARSGGRPKLRWSEGHVAPDSGGRTICQRAFRHALGWSLKVSTLEDKLLLKKYTPFILKLSSYCIFELCLTTHLILFFKILFKIYIIISNNSIYFSDKMNDDKMYDIFLLHPYFNCCHR
jgi:hypothetical protein